MDSKDLKINIEFDKLVKKIIGTSCLCMALFIFGLMTPRVWGQGETEEEQKFTIKEYLEQALPPQPDRKIVLDEATGLLTVTDTPSHHKLIRELIKLWDVGPKQITIEARFVELTTNIADELGVEWRDSSGGFSGSSNTGWVKEADVEGAGAKREWREFDVKTGTYFGAPLIDSGLDFFIGKTKASGSMINAYLKALESEKKANLLSAPKVTTLSGQMANIQIIRRLPYAEGTEWQWVDLDGDGIKETMFAKYSVAEHAIGITLEVTPTVGEESRIITLDIHPSIEVVSGYVRQDAAMPDDLRWPIIDTRSTQTSVIVKSGETVVMGGLIKDEDRVTQRKVPILGHIPLFGHLFRYKYVDREKKNLMIFITATLVTAEGIEVR